VLRNEIGFLGGAYRLVNMFFFTRCTKVLIGRFEYTGNIHTNAFVVEHQQYMRQTFSSLQCGLNIMLVNGNHPYSIQVRPDLNFGMTSDWFLRAYKESEADLIVKMDADVSLCSFLANKMLVSMSQKGYDYVGFPIYMYCGNSTERRRHSRCEGTDPQLSWYMQGGFYGLSRTILSRVLRRHPYRFEVYSRSEDVDVGRWVVDLEPRRKTIDCLIGNSWCWAYHWFRQGVDWSKRNVNEKKSWCSLKQTPMSVIRRTKCWRPCLHHKVNANARWKRMWRVNTSTLDISARHVSGATYRFPVTTYTCRHEMKCNFSTGLRSCSNVLQSGSFVYEHIHC